MAWTAVDQEALVAPEDLVDSGEAEEVIEAVLDSVAGVAWTGAVSVAPEGEGDLQWTTWVVVEGEAWGHLAR